MDLIESLDRTFDHAHGVIAGVRPDQLDAATPCSEWTVRDLLTHMVGVVAGMGSALSGRAPTGDFALRADAAGQFREEAAATLAAWQRPGVLDQVIDGGAGPMPARVLAGINLIDTATHSWDLAASTGQPTTLPDDVATAALEASQSIVSAELRPGRFGPELSPPAGAGATEQLVAFLGRAG